MDQVRRDVTRQSSGQPSSHTGIMFQPPRAANKDCFQGFLVSAPYGSLKPATLYAHGTSSFHHRFAAIMDHHREMQLEYTDLDHEYDEYGDFDQLMSEAHLVNLASAADHLIEYSQPVPGLSLGLSSSPPLRPSPTSPATLQHSFYVEERHPTPEGLEQYLPPDDSKNSSQSLPSDIDYTFSDPPCLHATPWSDPVPAASPPEHDLRGNMGEGAKQDDATELYHEEFVLDDGAEQLTMDQYPVYSNNPAPNFSDAVKIYEADIQDDEVQLISQTKKTQRVQEDDFSVVIKEPPRVPFSRPPFPPPVQPNSIVPGLTAQSPLLRCFRVGEIPNALRNREGTTPLVELFGK